MYFSQSHLWARFFICLRLEFFLLPTTFGFFNGRLFYVRVVERNFCCIAKLLQHQNICFQFIIWGRNDKEAHYSHIYIWLTYNLKYKLILHYLLGDLWKQCFQTWTISFSCWSCPSVYVGMYMRIFIQPSQFFQWLM